MTPQPSTDLECCLIKAHADANRTGETVVVYDLNPDSVHLYVIRKARPESDRVRGFIAQIAPDA